MGSAVLAGAMAACSVAGAGAGPAGEAAGVPVEAGPSPVAAAREVEVLGRADYGWSVRTPEGRIVPLERFRGRPLFVNVWATWCPPCVAELGSIRDLMASVDTSRVAFLLVSPEEAEVVGPFLEGLGYALPAAVEHTRMPGSWGVDALPTTVVVDARGRIVLRHRGAADWNQPAVRAFLARLAGAP